MKKTLAEELSELNPTTDFDIEDEIVSEESGSESSDDEVKTNHYVKVGKSNLRDNAPKTLYGGSKVSRKDLFDGGVGGNEDEEEVEEDDEEEDEEEEEVFDSAEEKDSESGISIDGSESESESEEENIENNESDNESRNKVKELINKERQTIGKRVAQSNIDDALKGYSVVNQNKFFDQLIETRIKLQKSLNQANLLPNDYESSKPFISSSTKENISNIESKCYDILDNIFRLRSKIQNSDPVKTKKRKLSAYSDITSNLDSQLNESRTIILNKWSNKINSSSGSTALNAAKFKVINQSADQQVANNLNDMERLRKRTYLNRSSIKPLGLESIEEQTEGLAKNEMGQIFNDEDFYRILLNDLVDKKISNPINNITLLKNNQKALKNNKNIDTKASKGRKLKFTVQEPIAHFEAPMNVKWDDHQIDELFGSLLGQKIDMNEIDEEDDEDDEINNDGIKLFS